jgi:hypothetical protein
MAGKDGRENQEDDLGQRQRLFQLELSFVFPDKVPSPGIVFAQMKPSKNAISDIIYSLLLLTVSAPPETGQTSAGRPILVM